MILASAANRKSANKTVRGTVEFMAPEMLLHGKISAASDVWAFSCTAYELCAGGFI